MNATATSKVKILKIEIVRAEGPVDKCGKRTFVTWNEANSYLLTVCMEKPRGGGADKCDFRLVYEDGETYAGHYEANHPESPHHDGNLTEHVRKHLEFTAGLGKPDWMTQERYDNLMAEYRVKYPKMEADSLRFLKGYALADESITTTDAPSVTVPATSGKESAMTTVAATAPTTTTTDKPDSKAVRAEHLRIRDEQDLPPVAIRGNTFPVRRVLWTLGGAWNEDAKAWMLPAHTATEGQRITDEVTAKAAAKAAAKPAAPAPAPAAKPAPVQTAKPAPVAAPAKATVANRPTTPAAGKLQPRIDALVKGATLLRDAAKAENHDALVEALTTAMELIQAAR
jgi:hypothetical protein